MTKEKMSFGEFANRVATIKSEGADDKKAKQELDLLLKEQGQNTATYEDLLKAFLSLYDDLSADIDINTDVQLDLIVSLLELLDEENVLPSHKIEEVLESSASYKEYLVEQYESEIEDND